MKKIILVCLTFILVFSLCTLVSFAATDKTATVTVTGAEDLLAGDTFSVEIIVSGSNGISGVDLGISYDRNILEYISVDTELNALDVNKLGSNSLYINYQNDLATEKNELTLCELTFKVNPFVAKSTIDNSNGFSSLVFPTQQTTSLNIFNLTIADKNMLEYSVDEIVSVVNDFVVRQMGDVDGNGEIKIVDAARIARYLNKEVTGFDLTDLQKKFADVTSDGSIKVTDVTGIQRFLNGKINFLGHYVDVEFVYNDGTSEFVVLDRGGALNEIPLVPEVKNKINGRWSTQKDIFVEPKFNAIKQPVKVYAVYDDSEITEAMQGYIDQLLIDRGFSNLTLENGSITLPSRLSGECANEYADITWASSDTSIFEASTGAFYQPAYSTNIELRATMKEKVDGNTISTYVLTIPVSIKGKYSVPDRETVEAYIKQILEYNDANKNAILEHDLILPVKWTSTSVNENVIDTNYEIKFKWYIDSIPSPVQVNELKRGVTEKSVRVIVEAYESAPNGAYGTLVDEAFAFDVILTPVSSDEVRAYVIEQIKNSMSKQIYVGYEDFKNVDVSLYDCSLRWESLDGNVTICEDKITNINSAIVSGTTLPLMVTATYHGNSFSLNYQFNASVDNDLIGVFSLDELSYNPNGMDEELMKFLKSKLNIKSAEGSVPSKALQYSSDDISGAEVPFVNLDLRGSNVKSLRGIQYCSNLRYLNISGLNITDVGSFTCLASLTELEVFIASGCDISNDAVEEIELFDDMSGLKLVDLSFNKITSLTGLFSSSKMYNKLSELYLNDNLLGEAEASIDLISNMPLLTVLELSNNLLDDTDIASLSFLQSISKLSIANNRIKDISIIENLTSITELYLQNNQINNISCVSNHERIEILCLSNNEIEDVSALYKLTNLTRAYLDNNKIVQADALNGVQKLEYLDISNNLINTLDVALDNARPSEDGTYPGLIYLYAENNKLSGTYSFVRNLTGLKVLCLSGNSQSAANPKLNDNLRNLTKLETLTLSGKPLASLSFLQGEDKELTMRNLKRLEIASCNIPAVTNVENSLPIDNLKLLSELSESLIYLDISNNEFFTPEDWNAEETGTTLVGIAALSNLEKLSVFYANNVPLNNEINTIFESMNRVQFISLENSGLTGSPNWLGGKTALKYINIANNNINEFNWELIKNNKDLEYLYIDTLYEKAKILVNNKITNTNLTGLSLEGYEIINFENTFPDMPKIKFLNLKNTGMSDFVGMVDITGEHLYSLDRYTTLEYLDVSQSDVNIFTKANLDMLYENFADIYVNLYADSGIYVVPEGFEDGGKLNADREAAKLLELYLMGENSLNRLKDENENDPRLKNLQSVYATIEAAETVGEDNNKKLVLYNKQLPTTVGGYEVEWIVNSDSYSIEDGYLKIDDSNGVDIGDELTLTASVNSIVENEASSIADFKVTVKSLSIGDKFIKRETDVPDSVNRGTEFQYRVSVIACTTEGFGEVAPSECVINYSYNDKSVELVDKSEGKFKITEEAALDSIIEVSATVEDKNGNVENVESLKLTVGRRNVTVSFETNGGENIASVTGTEESEVTVKPYREGYTFAGWYTDSGCNTFAECYRDKESTINKDSASVTKIVIPSKGCTLYAKWTINSYKFSYTSGGEKGGSISGATNGGYYNYGTSITITASYNGNENNYMNCDGVRVENTHKFTMPAHDVSAYIHSDKKSCFAGDTLVTLADGSQKKIEDLKETDELLVFDHESGEYVAAPILFIENDGWREYEIINLVFSNGQKTRIIDEHAFFDLTLNKYVYIDMTNYSEFVGHSFARMNEENGEIEAVILEDAYVAREYAGCYSLITVYHMNYFIDGMFSMPGGMGGLFNFFEYDENLAYDEEKMQADIEEYGLYTYEDFEDYVPYDVYEYMFPAKYFKVAVGKGMITYEEILGLIEFYLVKHGIV